MTILRELRRIAAANRSPVIVDEWRAGSMTGVVFESEPYSQRSTEVFAYIAEPPERTGSHPAVVLVHGGGGIAYAEWATMWAQRGYVAIAMDTVGHDSYNKALNHGWPYRGEGGKFWSIAEGVDQSWMYHAVAAVMHSISLVSSRSDVESDHIFLDGISWGAHIAELVASIDPRVAGAAFLYGSGFLRGQKPLAAALDEMPVRLADCWQTEFDVMNHATFIACPTLWITGARDASYDVTRFQRTVELASGPTTLKITFTFSHSHEDGWAPAEICEFFNHLRGIVPALPVVRRISNTGRRVQADFISETPIAIGVLHETSDNTSWPDRLWATSPAIVEGGSVTAEISQASTAVLLTVSDSRGLTTSSRLLELQRSR